MNEFIIGIDTEEKMYINKFNAERIRRRMREQNDRFGSKGKAALSSKEAQNLSPKVKLSDVLSPSPKTRDIENPGLTIAVTMSEDGDDQNYLNEMTAESDESETGNNVSAWAMMEHYQQNIAQQLQYTTEQNNISLFDSSLAYESYSFESSDSENSQESIGDENGSLAQKIFAPQRNSWGGKHVKQLPPAKIECEDDDDCCYSSDDSTVGQVGELPLTKNINTPTGKLVEWPNGSENVSNDSELLEDLQDDDEMSSALVSKPQPTPTRLKLEWQEEYQSQDGDSTPPASLFQESMIQSDCNKSSGEVTSLQQNTEVSDPFSVPGLNCENETQLSVVSLQPSEVGMTETTSNIADKPEELSRNVLAVVNGPENFAYLTRIEELEKNLKDQRNNTDNVQSKLKDRVVELEQALRATAATPRGTTVQENPLKTLLDRNQTLVKEVRFADQTCVELSSKNSSLEAQNMILQEQVRALEEENDLLRKEQQAKENIHAGERVKQQEEIQKLSSDLHSANEVLRKLKKKANNEDARGYDNEKLVQLVEHLDNVVTEQDRLISDELESLKVQEDAKMDSTLTTSSDIMSEVSKFQTENDFLGRQLGSVQEKLDEKMKELEEERRKSRLIEDHWKSEVQQHILKIETLEKIAHQMHLYQEEQSAPHLLHADRRVLALEKELIQAKANIETLKCEAEKVQANECPQSHQLVSGLNETLSAEVVKDILAKVYSHYQHLEDQVKEAVDGYIERIERLSFAVEHLRSSLLFEAESVVPESGEEISHRMMNPTIDSHQNSHKEDEMLELMEEARSPPKKTSKEIDESSDFGDISHLFSDDATLESINKTGSIIGSPVSPAIWKEPLDAAIRECQRVRERSSKLKQEIERKAKKIQNLEDENGKLSLEASRKGEEKKMVEKAFVEAQERMKELESNLDSIKDERDRVVVKNQELDASMKVLREREVKLDEHLTAEHTKQEALLQEVQDLEQALDKTKLELDAATDSFTDYKTKYDDLLIHFDMKAFEVTEQKNIEINSIQQCLKKIQNDNDLIKASYQEATKEVAHLQEENAEYQKLLTELESLKQKVISDSEDQILESQYNLEAIRSERAELKSKLSMKEKESESLKEALKIYKEKAETQLDQNSLEIQKLRSEQSDLCLKSEELAKERRDLFEFLSSIGFCISVIRDITIAEESSSVNTGVSKCTKELSYWKEILPSVSETIQLLWKNKSDFDQLRQEAESLTEDLNVLKGLEDNYKKQIEDERTQNERFNALFGQAELEMERSANQIREMSIALSELQEKEVEANKKAKTLENECVAVNQELKRSKNEMALEKNQLEMKLADLSADLEIKEARLSEINMLFLTNKTKLEQVSQAQKSKEAEETQLRSLVDSLETKCSRLRDYIKKLTKKCEEWELSYDQQVRTIEKLQGKNSKMREKASEFASRYHRLKGDIQRRNKSHHDDRAKWTFERSTIHEVHAKLEEELELITKELDG